MKLTTRQIFSQITGFWKSQSKKNKILILSISSALILIAAVVSILLNSSGYVVLYSGLSSSEAGKIVSRLNEMGIDCKTQSEGTILVLKEEESQLKMTLATEGYPQSTLNYDIFTGNAGFMTTDYEKKKYLLFQLQNRLQDAIKTIRGINEAIVTISLPEDDSFVLQEDKVAPSASVVLDLSAGVELSSQQIKGIEALVSKSVPGLETKNVAIVNNMGDMLGSRYDDDNEGISYTRFELEKNISSNIESRIAKLLVPIFGSDCLRVAVNTTVDMNKKVSEQTTYTPASGEKGLITSQDTSKESVGAGAGGEGGVVGTGTNTGVTTYPETNGADTGSYSETSSTSYINNQIVEQVEKSGYEIRDITVAVLIGKKELNSGEIASYKQMVAFAAGVSPDKVVITNAVFASSETSATPDLPETLEEIPKEKMIYLAAAGVFALLLIILIMIMLLGKRRKKKRLEEEESYVPGGPLDPKLKIQPIPGEIVLNETREQGLKRQIKDFSSASPEIVAQLIRTWIKEDDDN